MTGMKWQFELVKQSAIHYFDYGPWTIDSYKKNLKRSAYYVRRISLLYRGFGYFFEQVGKVAEVTHEDQRQARFLHVGFG
jgi:hypothetical protein